MQSAIFGLDALRALEQRAAQAGINLMQRAAQATADWISARVAPGAQLLFAVGPGNNGGDALIAARLLHQAGFRVAIFLPETPHSPLTQQALADWLLCGQSTLTTLPHPYPRPDLIIDGLFGIGIGRAFTPAWCARIERINASGAPILALDTPSGLNPYTGYAHNAVVHATATLTFLCHKPGLFTGAGADLAGEVFLERLAPHDWGCDQPEGAINQPQASGLVRQRNSHKGSYGCVAIVGGTEGMLGAALLAGRAALSAGAGKVHVCALDLRLPVDTGAPELMLRDADQIPECDVLALGPGLGQDQAALHLLNIALERPVPLVLDADGLNLVAKIPELAMRLSERQAPAIITPHPAEAARLLAMRTEEVQADRLGAARRLALHLNAIVILKGAGSLIVAPDGYYHLNTTGGPALASAGQGDVLTGVTAAMLAQGQEPFEAASLAAFVHGMVADEYVQAHGGPIGLTASSTAAGIGRQINRLLPARQPFPLRLN